MPGERPVDLREARLPEVVLGEQHLDVDAEEAVPLRRLDRGENLTLDAVGVELEELGSDADLLEHAAEGARLDLDRPDGVHALGLGKTPVVLQVRLEQGARGRLAKDVEGSRAVAAGDGVRQEPLRQPCRARPLVQRGALHGVGVEADRVDPRGDRLELRLEAPERADVDDRERFLAEHELG